MVDTPAVETPAVETPAVETPVVVPETNYFNSDGTFNEGWQSTLPEGYRDEPSLKTVNDGKVLARMFVDTKKMVGKDMMEIPTDASDKVVWDAYHKAGGRPDTAEDYNLAKPEELPDEFYNAELATVAQGLFHKIGLSKKQVEALWEFNNKNTITQLTARKQAEELEMSELRSGLSTEWGAAFEQKKHLGNMAIEEGTAGDADFKARLTQKFGNDPDFIRYSANLGGKFAEGKSPNFANIPTPKDYQVQIDEIQANPLYLKGTQEQRMKLADQIMALREKMKPEAKTTV